VKKGEKHMAGQILVALKRDDQVDQVIPYIEEIAKPGMQVVFLIHYPVDGFAWLQARQMVMETGMTGALVAQKMAERYAMEGQKRLAHRKLFPACESLGKRGVEVAVDVYAGSLKKVVERYTRNGSVHVVVMPANAFPVMRFLQCVVSLFKRHRSYPVLLLRPGHAV
jgi:hypothetical protein